MLNRGNARAFGWIVALLAAAPAGAGAAVVVADDFTRGVSPRWTAGPERAQTAIVARGPVARVFTTPRRRGVTALSKDLPGAPRIVSVAFHARLMGAAPQTVARLDANGVALRIARTGRVELVRGSRTLARVGVGPRGRWHRYALVLDAASGRVVLSVDGRRGAQVRIARARPERRVRIGALDAHLSGPAQFGRVRLAIAPDRGTASPGGTSPGAGDRPPAGGGTVPPGPGGASPPSQPLPAASPGRFFAPTAFWNTPLAADAPVDPESQQLVAALATSATQVAPWINTTQYSVPIYTVPANQPTVNLTLNRSVYQSDAVRRAMTGVPIPPGAQPAAGSDGHLVIWQPSTDTMWEFWAVRRTGDIWTAGWAGKITGVSRSSGVLSPQEGATATSLPLVGGLITFQDIARGSIDHVLAMGIPNARAEVFTLPAQRTDGSSRSASAVPLGARFRLDPALDVESLAVSPFMKMIMRAAQRYGIVVRDSSGAVTLYAQDPRPGDPNPYGASFGGASPADLMRTFPWNRLQLMRMEPRCCWTLG